MQKPLSNIRILDLSHTLSGPFAARTLADLGADVIKVESLKGDETRSWVPQIKGESIYFLSVNRGLKSIALNLKEPRAREIMRRLVSKSDVVLENYRPGVAEDLNVDFKSLRRINRKIIYCSIAGFGFNGNKSSRPAYDLIIQALTGLMSTTGVEGNPPVRTAFALFDVIAGLMASNYILACLQGKVKPAHIEIPMYEMALSSMTYLPLISLMTQTPARRLGSAHPSIVPYQAFCDRFGKYFVVAAANDGQWKSLCRTLRLDIERSPEFKTNELRVQNREKLISELQQLFSRKPRQYWLSLLERVKVPAAPVYDVLELFDDPYIKKSGLIRKLNHRTIGKIPQLVPCVSINGRSFYSQIAPPVLGEHTKKVMKNLRYDDSEIRLLKEAHVIE